MAGAPENQVVSGMMREELLRRATVTSCAPRGEILFRRGDEVRGLYLVRSGKVSLSLETGTIPLAPRIAGPGMVVGLPATVSGTPYSLTAEVVEQAEVSFVPRTAMLDCLATNQQICFEVMLLLSSEISGTRAALKRGSPPHGHQA